jgi:4-diphosphocytidyl-2-C-methyl-D-erythritol kinase
MRLSTAAPAKINVCLFLGPVREDGRHRIVSVMQSISLRDRVTVELLPEGAADQVVCEGIPPEGNLVTLAIERLRQRGTVPPVRVVVDKRIPVAAGLAGGSSDAAAALRLLATATALRDDDLLHDVAAGLGADVPAALRPGRSLATAAGEEVRRIPGVPPYDVLVVPDPEGLSTGDVYREADRLGLPRTNAALEDALAAVEDALPDLPSELCVNELAPAALSLRPELADRLDALRDHGAEVALVSGSGPTTLGLFRDGSAAYDALASFPGAVLAQPVGAEVGEVLAS